MRGRIGRTTFIVVLRAYKDISEMPLMMLTYDSHKEKRPLEDYCQY
ncbi:hypothetical protein ACFL6S_16860 [Candidatus Poribacteria bacterium]